MNILKLHSKLVSLKNDADYHCKQMQRFFEIGSNMLSDGFDPKAFELSGARCGQIAAQMAMVNLELARCKGEPEYSAGREAECLKVVDLIMKSCREAQRYLLIYKQCLNGMQIPEGYPKNGTNLSGV